MNKSKQYASFESLDALKQKAIILLFEGNMTDEQIAKEVHRGRTTIVKWKKDETFVKAQQEYNHIVLDKYVPDAVKQLGALSAKAKSEMVRLQATTTILSMTGFGSTERSPELEMAQVRKSNAEADIAEAKAKRENNGDSTDNINVNIVMPNSSEEQKDNE